MTVHQLAPLPVVIPLLTAAAIAMTSFVPRRVHDLTATAAAAASAVLCGILLTHAGDGPIVEWLGGWRPHHGVATGISLTADQLGAGAALLASALLTAALVYSWVYFAEVERLVSALMLVLGAGMIGFCLTGDLFNMVVFFVLMTVAAVGLTAVETEHGGPLQGAINFAVVNGVAGFALLFGVALVYGRTGALNLAQIGMSLDHHPADALVAVSFALLALAFLTKAGIAPFHFWLPDAHAVAPAPVAALFSGAMVSTALLGVARLLSTAYAQPLVTHYGGVRAVLVCLGAVTALAAAVACFEQRHVKRLLAFATVSEAGVMLCGIGLLRDDALAGSALAAVGFGLSIAALFGATGALVRRCSSTDEFELAGGGRGLPLTAGTFVVAGLALASLPPTAGFYGRWLIGEGARDAGYTWLPALLALSSSLVAGAILRVAGRVFFGWGEREHLEHAVASEELAQRATGREEERDMGTGSRPSIVLGVMPLLLVAIAVGAGALPGFVDAVYGAAAHFRDFDSYAAAVLDGRAPAYGTITTPSLDTAAWLYAFGSLAGALGSAWVGLRGGRVFPTTLVDGLRAAHSGHVGDYVAWWTFGMTVIGGLVLWAIAG